MTRPTVRHLCLATALALLLSGHVPATAAKKKTPDRRTILTRQLAKLSAKAKAVRDGDERRELLAELEWTRHQLGPIDAAGRRVRCQALWHEAALASLERDIKGLRGPAAATPAKPMPRLRLALREMAAAALARAWAEADGPLRFRFDAVGTYVHANTAALEELLERAVGHLAQAGRPAPAEPEPPPPPPPPTPPKPEKPAKTDEKTDDDGGPAPAGFWKSPTASESAAPLPDVPDGEPAEPTDSGRDQALALVQDALGRLVGSAHTAYAAGYASADAQSAQSAARIAFVDALADLHRATAALDAAGADGTVVLPPEETPGLSEAHKAALAKAGERIAAIEDAAWQGIRGDLETYLATAEQGLKYPKARREAQRLLEVVTRTAAYVNGLLASKAASPAYVAERQETMADYFEDLGQREDHESLYRRLLGMAGGDYYRKALDDSPLSPEACLGLMALRHVPPERFGKGEKAGYRRTRFVEQVETVIERVDKDRSGRADAMDAHLATLFDQTVPLLYQAAEALGAAPDAEADVLRARAAKAAALAGDLGRVREADGVIRGVRALMAERGTILCDAVTRRLEGFVLDPSAEKREAREAFDAYVEALDPLATLRLPEKSHTAAAMRISGGAYRPAANRFGEYLTRNMASAAGGNTEYLESTLAAAPMFRLLRHRAVAEGLDVDPSALGCLEPFAFPAKPWAAFVPALDKRLVALMRQYGTVRGWSPGASNALGRWDRVYGAVVAAQHVTHQAAAGEAGDVGRLVRLLEHTAEPRVPTRTWMEWAEGFHTLEAAVCLMAGLPLVAQEHLDSLGRLRYKNRLKSRLGGWTFDPLE